MLEFILIFIFAVASIGAVAQGSTLEQRLKAQRIETCVAMVVASTFSEEAPAQIENCYDHHVRTLILKCNLELTTDREACVGEVLADGDM